MTSLSPRSLSEHKLYKRKISTSSLSFGLLTSLMIGAASLYAPLLNAAPIYKVIDEQTGQVTFTDNLQPYEQQAGKQISQTNISTGESSTANSNTSNNVNANSNNSPAATNIPLSTPLPMSPTSAPPSAPITIKAPRVNYQLTMIEPSTERAYRRPAQSIVVTVQLKPALQAGDSVSIYLDGDEVAQGLSVSIATVDILPGEHSVQAVVKNQEGQTLQQISRTVYVIQNTLTLQNNKKIAQQLLAYQQLPWHQKVLLKLRQDGKKPNMPSFTKPQADKPMTLEQPAKK
jgi:hypothetical protein